MKMFTIQYSTDKLGGELSHLSFTEGGFKLLHLSRFLDPKVNFAVVLGIRVV